MRNGIIKKINTFGKVGYIICKIGKIVTLIGAIVCLVGAALMCLIPKEAIKIQLTTTNTVVIQLDSTYDLIDMFDLDMDETVLEIGDNTYAVVGGADAPSTVTTSTMYISNLKWVLFVAVLGCMTFWCVFYFAEKLCKFFKECETPFTEEVSNMLMKFAYSLLGMGVFSMLGNSIINSFLTNETTIGIDINIVTVLLILCVFMLSFIFKYGTALQAQSDETL